MTGIWLISYIVVWILLIVTGFITLLLAREIMIQRNRFEKLQLHLKERNQERCLNKNCNSPKEPINEVNSFKD